MTDKNYWVPMPHIRLEDWQEDYQKQLEQSELAVRRFIERQTPERDPLLPIWAFTIIGLAIAGALYLAEAIGWLPVPNW